MRKTGLIVTAAAALIALPAAPASAQVSFGPQASYADDAEFGIGGRVGLGIPMGDGFFADMRGVFSFDYYLSPFGCSDCGDYSYWEATPFLAVPLDLTEGLDTYVGAGLNIAHFSVPSVDVPLFGSVGGGSSNEIGLAVIGGIAFPLGGLSAFSDLRITLGGGEQIVITGGLLFGG